MEYLTNWGSIFPSAMNQSLKIMSIQDSATYIFVAILITFIDSCIISTKLRSTASGRIDISFWISVVIVISGKGSAIYTLGRNYYICQDA